MTGGYDGFWNLASTELLVDGDSSWNEAGALPHGVRALGAVSFDNKIIATTAEMKEHNPNGIPALATALGLNTKGKHWEQKH